MTTDGTKLRALVVYAAVVPVALLLGVLLASPAEFTHWAPITLFLLLLLFPLIMKWHRPLLFASWNMTAVVFFLPGHPRLWLVMAFITLTTALVQRALLRDMRFIYAPTILLPLLYLAFIVYLTAKLTGGFGMAIFGSESIGGHRYIEMFGGIIGCMAMLTARIPPQKAMLYVGLFFLGSLTDIIGNTINFVTPSFYYLFLIFPVDVVSGDSSSGMIRFYGTSVALMGVFWYMLARFGIRETLGGRNLKRLALLVAVAVLTSFGGYRSFFILMALTFVLVFYFEGLFRSRFALPAVGLCVAAAVIVIPLADKLPMSMQRTLSFLPLKISPVARLDADASTEWRIQMWNRVLPDVPRYLWLGKGLLMDSQELDMANMEQSSGRSESSAGARTASDYHNGPLTTIIPFGIWGALGWIWFLAAALRASYLNYMYGEEQLKKINTLLLAYLLARTILFFFVFGNFYSDLGIFTGIVGLNLALNGGIRKPVRVHTVVRPVTLSIPTAFKPAHTAAVGAGKP
ncbi:MAG TPA: hypothetical protein VG167_11360 [Verrucomicrobiae bacterium]|nr:hypothetical protein [Verrucomicrobiae bacterium]